MICTIQKVYDIVQAYKGFFDDRIVKTIRNGTKVCSIRLHCASLIAVLIVSVSSHTIEAGKGLPRKLQIKDI